MKIELNKMTVSVIMPTYNEEETLSKIIDRVLKQKNVNEIIVVDDGSKDKSWNILKSIKNPKVKPFKHNKNQGKGAAIITGINKAKFDYILIQDADLEYDPVNYPALFEKATQKVTIFGSRLKTKNNFAYIRTYLGNIFITTIGNILFNIRLTDSYTCYKLIPTNIAKSLNLNSNGFEIEAEITGKLAKRKIPIVEVPISYKPRNYKQGKKIKAKDAIKGFLTYLKIRFS